MQFNLTINCDNAAFYREGRDENDEPRFDYLGDEVQEILEKAASLVRTYGLLVNREQVLFDSNGNNVGSFVVLEG